MLKICRFLLPALLWLSAGGVLWAAGEGQADLDKASDIKLSATTISDLSEVIRLAESALQKGLDPPNTEFAKKLLASTLLQRGHEAVKQVLSGANSPSDFRQKRQFALSDLEKAVKLNPKQPEAYLLIAQMNLVPGGEVKQAREAVDKALALGLDDPPSRAKALALRARLQTKPEKQLADLDEAVRLVPNDVTMLRTRARLLIDLDKLEPALADLDKAIGLDPQDGQLYEEKAVVLAGQKKYDAALVALDKACKLSPDSVMPLVQRARVHTLQTKVDAALADLNQALAVDPGNAVVLLMRAGLHQEKGDKGKALADVDRVLKLKPTLPLAIRTRALLLADSNRLDEAIGELEKLSKLNPKDAQTLMSLALLYGIQKKPAKAIETYTALLAEDPDEWQALRGRGDTYLNIGKQAEAIADYEKALKLQPKDHSLLNNLAWVLATSPDAKLRNGRRAVELATQACKVTDYKFAFILSTLAAAYAETGDFTTAIKWSSKAVQVGDKEHDDSLKKELASYQAKKPWREVLSEEKSAKTDKKDQAKPPAKDKKDQDKPPAKH